ncbi:hypothetical protein [Shewanella surugensis]|uniref:Uncharacterized protein n=1 Tax=Shewanella surugensis TaxID=212020 RepID=A0ABT0LGR2_9GAMM|nr:hypothetical protein [Shewanella surugensis]MCL1126902.1 hypothetical protein [Shewanella surugensis]
MNVPINISASSCVDNFRRANILCYGLLNPRGMAFTAEGDLLLIEAGAAEAHPPYSGQLTCRDPNTGAIKSTLLSGYRALNMQQRMLRDEIMGLADIAPMMAVQGEKSAWLIALTDYIQGSKMIEVQTLLSGKGGSHVEVAFETLFTTEGNINSLCYHPERQAWYCIKPDTNEVIEFKRNEAQRVVCVLPDLALGQEAVPVNIVYQASSQKLLISLFSGELGRGDPFKGIDFEKHQGEVIALDLNNNHIEHLVTGLTLPTGLCVTLDDKLFVTELCDDFLEPLPAEGLPSQPLHGGFKRFSGRLLQIDLHTRQCDILAKNLDTPSNLAMDQQAIYISEGMGLPGRLLPTLDGQPQELSGMIRKVSLTEV